MRRLFLVATFISCLPHVSGAECINGFTITTREALESSDIVFSGTVTKVEDPNAPGLTQVVTFVVDRVWKGSVTTEQVIHHRISTESRVFSTGEKLVVFAGQIPPADRERVGLRRDGPAAFAYRSFNCAGALVNRFDDLPRFPSAKPQ